jgi:threonine/homoserine/homoserine lactone efflux protein
MVRTAIELGAIAATAFVVGLSGAMMPGPLLAVTVTESSRRGASAGPLLMVGHMLLEAGLVVAVVLGLGSVLQRPTVVAVIGAVGGAVLGWMGVDMLRSVRRLSLAVERDERGRMHPIVSGIVVSLSNPYWTLWWATIGITYIMMGLKFGMPGLIAFFVGHIAADFAWYSFVSAGVSKGRRLFSDTVYRGIIGACGVVLVSFGAWFLASALGAFAA